MSKKTKATRKSAPAGKKKASSRRAAGVLAAVADAQPVAISKPADLETLIEVLRDQGRPVKVRLAALQSLAAARFASPEFPSIEGDYIAALREVASDPDEEMRRRALGILAREKDGFALKRLVQGLKNPDQALLPPEKALQLLTNDVHGDAYSVAREIVRNPPNVTAKREALRLLAADSASAPTFEAILRDKQEEPEIRQISAAALNALQPQKFQEHAREILLDPSENEDMHQASLTALTQFGAPELADDKKLMDRIDKLSTAASAPVKSSARRFLGKFSR